MQTQPSESAHWNSLLGEQGSLERLPGGLGIRVSGLDVNDLGGCGEALRRLIYEHKLVVFANQSPRPDEYVAFARDLGTPDVYLQDNYHHPDHPEIFVSSNGPIEGRKMGVARTGYYWHADLTFTERPLAFTMIYPQRLPKIERFTFFMDMRAALKRLPEKLLRKIECAMARHDGNGRYKIREEDAGKPLHELFTYIMTLAPGAVHPAIIEHPHTQEPMLFLNSGFVSRILGCSLEESWSVLREVFRYSEDDSYAIRYQWNEGDIAIWDNRSLLHKGSAVPPGEVSAMFRIGLYDGLPLSGGVPLAGPGSRVDDVVYVTESGGKR